MKIQHKHMGNVFRFNFTSFFSIFMLFVLSAAQPLTSYALVSDFDASSACDDLDEEDETELSDSEDSIVIEVGEDGDIDLSSVIDETEEISEETEEVSEDGSDSSQYESDSSSDDSDDEILLEEIEESTDNDISSNEVSSDEASSDETTSDGISAANAQTVDYILSCLDETLIAYAGYAETANAMIVKQTIADRTYMQGAETISEMYALEDYSQAFVTMIQAVTAVYNLNDDSDYFVSYANTMFEDEDFTVTDAVFAIYNTDGETVDGCIYDQNTGLLYIPKDLFYDEDGTYTYARIQVQFLQMTDLSGSMTMESNVEASCELEDGRTRTGSALIDILSFETSVSVDDGLESDDLTVYVNGIPTNDYEYDADSGLVTVTCSSAAIESLSVIVGDDAEAEENEEALEALSTAAEETTTVTALSSETISETASSASMSVDGEYTFDVADDEIVFSSVPVLGDTYSGSFTFKYGSRGYILSITSSSVTTYGANSDTDIYALFKILDSSKYTISGNDINLMANPYPTFALKLTGTVENEDDETIDFSNIGEYVAFSCAHVDLALSLGAYSSGSKLDVIVRVLSIQEDSDGLGGKVLLGILTEELYTQNGYGIVAFEYSVDAESYVYLTKSGGDGTHSLKGALYGVYNSSGTNVGYFLTGTGNESATGYVATTSTSKAATTDYYAEYNNKIYYRTSTKYLTVDPGTYYVKELVAPYTGYYVLSTSSSSSKTVAAGKKITFSVSDSVKPYISVKKAGGDGTYSLRGALFKVTNSDGDVICYFITRSGKTTATGYVATTDYDEADASYRDEVAVTYSSKTYYATTQTTYYVDPGTYTVTEVKAPQNGCYDKGSAVTKTVSAGGSATFTISDTILPSYIQLKKSGGDGTYSLNGALYGVYDSSGNLIDYMMTGGWESGDTEAYGYTVTTDASASPSTYSATYGGVTYYRTSTRYLTVDYGTYYVKELVAPYTGHYSLDSTKSSKQKVDPDETITFEVEEPEKAYLTLTKDGGDGTYSLRGALFKVTDPDGNTICYFITKTGKTTASGYVATTDYDEADENYRDEVSASYGGKTYYPTTTKKYYVDAGTYTVTEVAAPQNGAYTMQTETVTVTVSEGGHAVFELTDEIKTSWIYLIKTGGDGSHTLNGALYGVYSKDNDQELVGYFMTGGWVEGSTEAYGYTVTTDASEAAATYSATYNGVTYYRTSTKGMEVDYGTYYVKELTAPYTGYFSLNSEAVAAQKVSPGGTATFTDEDIENGVIRIVKTGVNSDGTDETNYSLRGALFKVYDEDGETICYFITKTGKTTATGYVATTDYDEADENYRDEVSATYNGETYYATTASYYRVDAGEYYVEELVAPQNGYFDMQEDPTETQTVEPGGTATFMLTDTLIPPYILMYKTGGDGTHSLNGALYGVYDSSGTLVGYFMTGGWSSGSTTAYGYTVTTDASEAKATYSATYEGVTYYRTSTRAMAVDPGTYYIKELTAPYTGYYALNTDATATQTVKPNETAIFSDEDLLNQTKVRLKKIASLDGSSSFTNSVVADNAAYSLEDAIFQISSTASESGLLDGCDNLTTDEDGYTDYVSLEPGTYYYREIQASEGYQISGNDEWVSFTVYATTDEDAAKTISVYELLDFYSPGTILKVDEKQATITDPAVFKLVYTYTTNSGNTTSMTYYYETSDGSIDFSDPNSLSTTLTSSSSVTYDDKLIFLAGTITISEYQAPEEYVLDDTQYVITLTVNDSGILEAAGEDSLFDSWEASKTASIENVKQPEMTTELLEAEDKIHYANISQDSITLMDTISYTNYLSGQSYDIYGLLYVLNEDGTASDLLTTSQSSFQTSSSSETYVDGSTSFEYTLSSDTLSELGGKTVVSYVYIYQSEDHSEVYDQEEDASEDALQWVTFNRTHLIIYKIDGDTETPLSGAAFALYNSDDELIATITTDEDGTAMVQDLDVGDYYLIETESPDGYLLTGIEHTFSILDSDAGTTITYTISDTELPILYSSGGIGVYVLAGLSVMILLLAGLLILFYDRLHPGHKRKIPLQK